MIKFIATDMDGTLVNDQGIINDKIFDLIGELDKKGIIFAAASGRFYSQLNKNFKKVKTDMLFIAHNGALVRYSNKGDILYSSAMSNEDINNILNLNPRYGEELFFAGCDEAYIANPSEDMVKQFEFYDVQVIILNSLDEVNTPIYKATFYSPQGVRQETLEYLKNNLSKNLEFVVSGDKWVDIMNKGVSKGHAIKMIQKKFKIDEKNTMVFGDYYNDLTMFRSAYYSYAMKNAPEDVKMHAKFIADSNNDNGVYNTIYKHIASNA